MHPETRLFLINKHLQENALVLRAGGSLLAKKAAGSGAKATTTALARRAATSGAKPLTGEIVSTVGSAGAKPLTGEIVSTVGSAGARTASRGGAIQLARNARPSMLGRAANVGTTALALRPSGGGGGTRPPSGGGGTRPPSDGGNNRGERNPNPNPAGRENLLRNVYSRRREGPLGRLKRTIKDVGMSGIDTLRRQQSGIYGDIAAQGLNIGSSRRMGPEFGSTGRFSRRELGVKNIRGFVRDVFGTTSKKDAEGKTIQGSAEPGVLSPVRGYFKASSKLADRAERRMGRGKGFFSRINRAPYKYGTYSKPSDSVYNPKASGTFRDPYQRERTI